VCRLQLCCDKEIWERCQKTEKSLGFPLKLRRSRVAGSASFGVGVVRSASWCVCACTEKWCVHFVWAQRSGYVRVWRTAPRCSGPQWSRPRLPVCRSRRGHPGRCSLAGGTGRGWPVRRGNLVAVGVAVRVAVSRQYGCQWAAGPRGEDLRESPLWLSTLGAIVRLANSVAGPRPRQACESTHSRKPSGPILAGTSPRGTRHPPSPD